MTSPRELYERKRTTASHLASKVRTGDLVLSGNLLAGAHGFLAGLSAADHIAHILLNMSLSTRRHPIMERPETHILSRFHGPVERALDREVNNTSFYPISYADTPQAVNELLSGLPGVTKWVALATTPMDAQGYFNFGPQCGHEDPAFRCARGKPDTFTVAEVNPHLPWICGNPDFGDNRVHISEVDFVIECPQPLSCAAPEIPSAAERALAARAAELVPDRATIQIGIGSLGDAVAEELRGKRGLGVHSEMMTDGLMKLQQAGVVTNAHKSIHPGKSVFTFAYGTEALMRWLDGNPSVMIQPVTHVNHACVVARNRDMVSINTGLTIDLRGQVAAYTAGQRLYSGPGGILDFAFGAQLAENGRSITMIRSTADLKCGRVSCIVHRLDPAGAVTIPECVIHWVVTEYGAVNLKGLMLEERARALIALAHPDYRESLSRQARDAGLEIDRKFIRPFGPVAQAGA